jgi:hypothetical protein
MRASPHLDLLVHRKLHLGLHLRQRRPQRLRFTLGCGQRHGQTQRYCQARGTADYVTAINHCSTSLFGGVILALNAALLIQFRNDPLGIIEAPLIREGTGARSIPDCADTWISACALPVPTMGLERRVTRPSAAIFVHRSGNRKAPAVGPVRQFANYIEHLTVSAACPDRRASAPIVP